MITQVGPKTNDKCPYEREAEGVLRQTEERLCKDQGRYWNNEISNQGMPATPRSWKGQVRI